MIVESPLDRLGVDISQHNYWNSPLGSHIDYDHHRVWGYFPAQPVRQDYQSELQYFGGDCSVFHSSGHK
jgi:hypothetical protein